VKILSPMSEHFPKSKEFFVVDVVVPLGFVHCFEKKATG